MTRLLLLVLLVLGPAALAETYEAIDCPDAFRTEARSINDRGDIVGICEDANGAYGLLLRRGVFTLIDHSDGVGPTAAFGINNRGDVAGRWIGEDTLHGNLLRRGRFTTIDPPDSTFTVARGIDDAGRIVGFYVDNSGLEFRGFLRDARGYRAPDFPGAAGTGAFGASVTRIVGGYSVQGGGWSTDPDCPDCFTYAFLLTRRGVLQELAFPGALETVANGINAFGQVVGSYAAEDGSIHGFPAGRRGRQLRHGREDLPKARWNTEERTHET